MIRFFNNIYSTSTFSQGALKVEACCRDVNDTYTWDEFLAVRGVENVLVCPWSICSPFPSSLSPSLESSHSLLSPEWSSTSNVSSSEPPLVVSYSSFSFADNQSFPSLVTSLSLTRNCGSTIFFAMSSNSGTRVSSKGTVEEICGWSHSSSVGRRVAYTSSYENKKLKIHENVFYTVSKLKNWLNSTYEISLCSWRMLYTYVVAVVF